MGREYKFRGLTNAGTWVYGSYQADVLSIGRHTIIYADRDGFYCEDEVDPETVGQYTGLKDKNGTEIYEADLLDDGDGIGEVEWVQEHCAFMVFYRTESGSVYGYLESDGQLKSTVVRGNIHQHPELLKEGDGS